MNLEQLQRLLAAGVQHGASDIHLRVGDPPVYRVRGTLAPLKYDRLTPTDTLAITTLIIQDPDVRAKLDTLQEYDTSYSIPGIARFRVNVHRQRGSLSLVLRIIPQEIPTIEGLGIPPVIRAIAENERGLVLVTGATGSGKSSTLAAMIRHINETRRVHIVTIEDPIEFLHRDIKCHINQREVGTDTGSFGQALRRVLRQDPDVILIGEIRDLDTLDTALKAADTGHLVFSTLHTTDATQTINRILSFYPPHQQNEVRFALSNALAAVVSLRLVPRADKPGRVPACEVLMNTAAVREQIRDVSKTLNIPDLIREGTVQYGMQSFDQSLMSWYTKHVISYENALFYATNPNELALRVQGVAGSSDTSWDEFQTDETP